MPISSRRSFALALIVALAALPAFAKPNFSGDWKLNINKSDFGPIPAPSSMSQKITHEDPALKINVKQSGEMGDFEWEGNYTTDGKESSNKFRESTSKSLVKWDADALSFDTKGTFGDNDYTLKDKWVLSPDGKVLTMERHWASSMGEADQKLVFDKQ